MSDKRSPMDSAFCAQIRFKRPTVTNGYLDDARFALRNLERDVELQARHDLCRTWFCYDWQAAMKSVEPDRFADGAERIADLDMNDERDDE